MRNLFLLIVLSMTTSAFAMPVAERNYTELKDFSAELNGGVNFEGIIALNNCSGSLIRFYQSNDNDFALMLTNGHCTGNFIEPGKYVYNVPVSRSVYILDPRTGSNMGAVKTERLVYGTMTKTDMAIYQLNVTYSQIEKKYGIRPLLLGHDMPTPGSSIEVISGYWKKNYVCALESIVPVIREDKWSWKDSLKYTRECHTEHGSSGSPILSPATREVIGINNTGSDDGERCTMNNPCEVDKNGNVSAEKGRNYGQQTYWVYSCLNANNQIDLNLPRCELTR